MNAIGRTVPCTVVVGNTADTATGWTTAACGADDTAAIGALHEQTTINK